MRQTAAQKQVSFNKVLGKANPADLFTKYLDEATVARHTEALAHKFTIGRALEAPKLHLLQFLARDSYEDVVALSEAMNCNNSLSRYSRQKTLGHGSYRNIVVMKSGDEQAVINKQTGSGQ